VCSSDLLISNEGKADKMILATELLDKRIQAIREKKR
jgi:hypothetical protein